MSNIELKGEWLRMIYYRVALQANQSDTWRWRSTILTSLNALFGFLKLYSMVPRDHIRVFFSSSPECMDEMLARENKGLASNSVTVEQFLKVKRRITAQEINRLEAEVGTQEAGSPASTEVVAEQPSNERSITLLEVRRLELELGTSGDHDIPYTFALPALMPQLLAWTRLLVKVQAGELQP